MSVFELIYSLGVVGVRKVAKPIASAMRKGVNMHPTLQQSIAQTAKKKQIEEKEVIEKAAQHLVIYTIAGSALIYYQTRPSQQMETIMRHRQELEKLQQKLLQLQQKLPPQLVRDLEE